MTQNAATEEGYWIDLLVLWQDEAFAVEIDDTGQPPRDRKRHMVGGALPCMPKQLPRALRWREVFVAQSEWADLKGSAERRAYLSRTLQLQTTLSSPGVTSPVTKRSRQ
eukprot:gnl/TRDRNA2_/TRDRNA2_115667_c0_seq1.p2 gnl/TRDRNA2_/TRDRNA2_115667_c0~~gnl/TRDRNA2_/TRDRNA2_115667_c0_seq1.p2  ORF type:complete len:109 (-),score=14.74 gnl/TRDRNA2_/TRDRNA2_115667_c0_seq1:1-327(-)